MIRKQQVGLYRSSLDNDPSSKIISTNGENCI